MFVEFEKDAPTGQTKAFAVNVDNVLKIEPSMAAYRRAHLSMANPTSS